MSSTSILSDPFAQITNRHYRSIGLGVSGYHHALAIRGIRWESEEHLSFMDKIFERINYAAIEASAELAKEKDGTTTFEGSDWQTGATLQNAIMTHPHGKHWPQRLQHPNEKCLSAAMAYQQHQHHSGTTAERIR